MWTIFLFPNKLLGKSKNSLVPAKHFKYGVNVIFVSSGKVHKNPIAVA